MPEQHLLPKQPRMSKSAAKKKRLRHNQRERARQDFLESLPLPTDRLRTSRVSFNASQVDAFHVEYQLDLPAYLRAPICRPVVRRGRSDSYPVWPVDWPRFNTPIMWDGDLEDSWKRNHSAGPRLPSGVLRPLAPSVAPCSARLRSYSAPSAPITDLRSLDLNEAQRRSIHSLRRLAYVSGALAARGAPPFANTGTLSLPPAFEQDLSSNAGGQQPVPAGEPDLSEMLTLSMRAVSDAVMREVEKGSLREGDVGEAGYGRRENRFRRR